MFDKMKQSVDGLKDKLAEEIEERGDKIGANIDNAADFVDDKTGGRYSDHIDKAANAVKDAGDNVDGVDDDDLGPDSSARPAAVPVTPSRRRSNRIDDGYARQSAVCSSRASAASTSISPLATSAFTCRRVACSGAVAANATDVGLMSNAASRSSRRARAVG